MQMYGMDKLNVNCIPCIIIYTTIKRTIENSTKKNYLVASGGSTASKKKKCSVTLAHHTIKICSMKSFLFYLDL